MSFLKRRANGYQFQIWVPGDLVPKFFPGAPPGKRRLYTKGLATTDYDLAYAKALTLAGRYKVNFALMRGARPARTAEARQVYDMEMERLRLEKPDQQPGRMDGEDGLHAEQDNLLEQAEKRGWRQHDENDADYEALPLPGELPAKWDATVDYRAETQGKSNVRSDAYALAFSETAAAYLGCRKGDLTAQTVAQHEAIYRLFVDFIGDKPLRKVTRPDAVAFFDVMREFDPD